LADVGQEDLADAAVLVHAGRDVTLVPADREFVRDRLALARHPVAARWRLRERLLDRLVEVGLSELAGCYRLALLGVGPQRLRGLGAVAVDRERLDPAPPRLRVGVGDVIDCGGLGQVYGLRDR